MEKFISVIILLVLFPFLAFSQAAKIISEPENNHILNVTREWSKLVEIRDLRMKKFGEDDIEIRLWVGYGLGRTTAGIISRTNGDWKFISLNVDEYQISASDSLAKADGNLPPDILGKMGGRCTIGIARHMGSGKKAGIVVGTTYNLDCPHIYQRVDQDSSRLNQLWENLKEAGILDLPPDDNILMLDGQTYLIELRHGLNYRASIFRHPPDLETEEGKRYQQVINLLAPHLRMWHLSTDQ